MTKEDQHKQHIVSEDKAATKRAEWYQNLPPKAYELLQEIAIKAMDTSSQQKELIFKAEEKAQDRLAEMAQTLPSLLAEQVNISNIFFAWRRLNYLIEVLEASTIKLEEYSKKQQEVFQERLQSAEESEERKIRLVEEAINRLMSAEGVSEKDNKAGLLEALKATPAGEEELKNNGKDNGSRELEEVLKAIFQSPG